MTGERREGLTSPCAVPAEQAGSPQGAGIPYLSLLSPHVLVLDRCAQSEKGETEAMEHVEMGSWHCPPGQ